MARKPARKPRVVARGKVLRVNAGTQARYLKLIMPHVESMIADVRKQIETLFAKDFALKHFASDSVGMDEENIASQTRILMNAIKKKYDQLFGSIASDAASKMADGINRNSYQNAKESVKNMYAKTPKDLKHEAKKLTLNSKTLDKSTLQILKASSANATSFIQSIPEHYLNRVSGEVYKSIVGGDGMKGLVPFFEKFDNGTKNWVHNTAMDQTRKLYNGLNKGRMQNAGIKQGEWIHSGGSQHPRELHQDFDGEIYDLEKGAPVGDDDGNYVDAGEEPNCRCTFAPIITDDPPEDENEETEE